MSKRSELEIDAALAALARDVEAAAPLPGRALADAVLADAAVAALAREAAGAAPRPGPELVARVLADAAEVTASRPVPARACRAGVPARGGLLDWLFGWQAGAVAAMTLALAIGIGLGFEMEAGSLPVLDERGEDGAQLALAGLDSEFDFVEGL
jgi:hypothetical protein